MYERLIDRLQKIMDFIARYTLLVVLSLIFVVGLFIKAMYSFDDFPYFTFPNKYDFLAALLVLAMFAGVYLKRDWIQQHLNYRLCAVFFVLCALAYVLLVPIKPFSDMDPVYNGALHFSQFQWDEMLQDEYWEMFPGNIRLAVFWGILIIPFPKTLLTFKVWNIFFVYMIAFFARKTAKEYGVKYYNLVYLFLLSCLSLFLYINQIYFDVPVMLMCIIAVYLYKKYDNPIPSFLILGLARYLRQNVTIFVVAFAILFLFENREMFRTKKWLKQLGRLAISLLLFLVVSRGLSTAVQNRFIDGNFQSYPFWNQIYIGINEAEFGFMDNDFSYDRSAQDVINRVEEYGPVRMGKIILKKTFWLWSQGTYQAERYAFGGNVADWSEKFEYETILTNHLLRDDQPLRRFINAFMRAQYFVLFGLMILAFLKKKNTERFRLFYYIIIATFLIMLVYELKSRYILHLLPIMAILAGTSMEKPIIKRGDVRNREDDQF